jgi:hypothetical protein
MGPPPKFHGGRDNLGASGWLVNGMQAVNASSWGLVLDVTRPLCPSAQHCPSRPVILRRFDVHEGVGELTMGGNGERLDDRVPVLPAVQSNDPRWNWASRLWVRRVLIAAYLLTLAALATVGWIDALRGGVRTATSPGACGWRSLPRPWSNRP